MGNILLEVTPIDVSGIMGGAVSTLTGYFTAVAPIALGLAIAVFGLRFAWHLVKGFVH